MAFSPLADLPFLFSDFGVPVVAGSVQTVGIFDHTLAAESFGQESAQVQVDVPSVLIPAGALPGVKNRSPLTVDGVAFTVRERKATGDGALERLFLLKVTP